MLYRLLALSALSVSAWAGIIANGDFETTSPSVGLVNNLALNGLTSPQWDVFAAIPGWVTLDGAGIEIQAGSVVTPHSGQRYVELDSHPTALGDMTNSAMRQTVTLAAGDYVLSFWYRPRTNATGDNGIQASVGGLAGVVADGIASDFPDWRQFSTRFTVTTGGSYDVVFQALGRENWLGGFLDDVSLEAVHAPEPATWGTFAIAGLIFAAVGIRRN